jgi:N-methylhydantoinase B
VEATIERLYEYTRRRTEAELAAWPEGVYEAETFVDDDGVSSKPIRIPVKLTIRNSHVDFDFTGAEKQRKAPMNSTYAQTYASVVYSIKALIPADIPVNHGFYQTISLTAPSGTVVNCSHPSAVVGGWEVGMKVVEGAFRALAKAMPQRVAAEGKKTILHIAFGGVDPRTNQSYVYLETLAGGYGGRPNKDGEDAVQAHHQNTENAPIEEMEIGYPVMIDRYELVPDSEGPGEYRGGLGLRRVYKFRDHDATVTFLADTVKIPPHGMLGGMDGQPAEFSVARGGKRLEVLPSKITFYSGPQDLVSIRTPGGGGYGDPLVRDPGSVLSDVVQEKVSVERARKRYGVVIDATTLRVDESATARTRARLERMRR